MTMTYRNALIERSRQFESENDEPAVLDYLQLRNRQCLYAWQMKRAEYALATARQGSRAGTEAGRTA
jgi:hypothetical protein